MLKSRQCILRLKRHPDFLSLHLESGFLLSSTRHAGEEFKNDIFHGTSAHGVRTRLANRLRIGAAVDQIISTKKMTLHELIDDANAGLPNDKRSVITVF